MTAEYVDDGFEQRRASVPRRPLRVREQRVELDGPVEIHASGQTIKARLRNVSQTGACVFTLAQFDDQELLRLDFKLGLHHFALAARVVREDEDERVGFEFIDLAREERLALISFVAEQRAELRVAECLSRLSLQDDDEESFEQEIEGICDRVFAPMLKVVPRPAQDTTVVPFSENDPYRLPRGFNIESSLTVVPVDVDFEEAVPEYQARPMRRTRRGWMLAALMLLALSAAGMLTAARLDWSGTTLTRVSTEPLVVEEVTEPVVSLAPRVQSETTQSLKLLKEADRLYAQGRWSLPLGENALERYRRVLKDEPSHALAIAGVGRICDGYERRAIEVLARGDVDGARWRYQRVLAILSSETGSVLEDRSQRATRARLALAELNAS